jgi:hypothetical protein
MKYSVEMGSGAMIYLYIPNFIKTGSGIQKSRGGNTQTHRQHDLISLILFVNKESRLKIESLPESLFSTACILK